MPTTPNPTVYDVLGTAENDVLQLSGDPVGVNGRQGDDRITTASANDLAAGDMVGLEWTFLGGEWVYDPAAVLLSDYGVNDTFDDLITTGAGNDVLLGNGGDDTLYAGAGNDRANGGRGDDAVFGGYGHDIINLEVGNDFAQAGYGDDTVNGGAGDDVIFGDIRGDNLLVAPDDAATFADLASAGAWTMSDTFGATEISQSAATITGETYKVSFGLAANFAGGKSSGTVDVLWNGAVIDTVRTTSGAYETFEVDVVSTGSVGELSFRAVEDANDVTYNFDGPIISYEKDVVLADGVARVAAFAPGQAKLYQVIDGQLNVFDVQTNDYVATGVKPDFKINSIGFNVEDDLIYGVAKSAGTDSLGQSVASSDIVMIDASGATYRIGEGFYGDYVGDFDDSGNLWTFQSELNRVSVVDVDRFDADGNPHIDHFHFKTSLFGDRTYDIAFNAADGHFYAVVSPAANGQSGKVVRIDVSTVADGGLPTFTDIAITGTVYGDTMQAGLVKGAFGAVFMDGDANLYFGLNRGDHDMDASTSVQGAIFQVHADWTTGQAYAEFMSSAPTTGSNDGAVDPRSSDAFSQVDADAAVLLRDPVLTKIDGGNDDLRGGAGNDEIYGNAGDDRLHGGVGDDALYGGDGDDRLIGAAGHDGMSGGAGDDKMLGQLGDDVMHGGAGADYMNGGVGDDIMVGGDGADKIVGAAGRDVIDGGAGNDHIWGGSWSGDLDADTFVFSAGTGRDYVHDFKATTDAIDLSQFNTTIETVLTVTRDLGWATVIDLARLDGAQDGDRIVLSSVAAHELDSDNFIL